MGVESAVEEKLSGDTRAAAGRYYSTIEIRPSDHLKVARGLGLAVDGTADFKVD